jgi:hypothetical protein
MIEAIVPGRLIAGRVSRTPRCALSFARGCWDWMRFVFLATSVRRIGPA